MPERQVGIDYPASYDFYDLRELLRLSQTNITKDSVKGEQFATAAYDRAMQPSNQIVDPTAAGEAATKGGLQAEIAAGNDRSDRAAEDRSDAWYDESVRLLSGDDDRSKREIRATYSNRGRALGIRASRTLLIGMADRGQAYIQTSRQAFQEATKDLDMQEPYGPMAFRHWATLEAVAGRGFTAIGRAAIGLVRSLVSKPESANQPVRSRLTPEHMLFVGKQALGNLGAGVLGAESLIPPLRKRVIKRSLSWLA